VLPTFLECTPFDMAFLLHTEANKGKWTIMADPTYLNVSKDVNAGPVNAKVELKNWIVDFGLFYRPYQKALSGTDGRIFAFELLAGGRYMSLDQTLEFSNIADVQETKQWIDPIIGVRMMVDLTEKLAVTLRGDIGGFGVGSDFAWNVASYLGW